MSVAQAIILGIIQGLTEFLPVSSSGHLALFKGLFNLESDGGVLFDVLLHVATLIAVFAMYYKDIIKLLAEFGGICADVFVNIRIFFRNISAINKEGYKQIVTNMYRKFVVMLLISCIPTAIIGALLNDVVDVVGDNLLVVGFCLIGTGGILFLSDTITNGVKKQKEATYKDAAYIGISQGVATLPGISRSGTTITACLLCGFDRKYAVKYSFIMSMPAILGALILKLFKLSESAASAPTAGIILGMLLAAIVGYASLYIVNKLVLNKGFKYFWIYCMVMGTLSIIVFLVKL